MTEIYLFLILLLEAVTSVRICSNPPSRLRNSGYLGTSFNPALFSPLFAEAGVYGNPVFKLTYTTNKTTEDGCYLIPDRTTGLPEPITDFASLTVEIKSGFDYQHWVTKSASSGGGLLNAVFGSGGGSINTYFRLTTESQQYVYFSIARRNTYHLNFEPAYTPPLADPFIASVKRLPTTFNPADPANFQIWSEFFRAYFPFIIVDMRMGGSAFQNVMISIFNAQILASANIDVKYEAGIAMAVAMGLDVHGSDRTDTHLKFKQYSRIALTQCYGGAAAANCSWEAWSPTVDDNPLPIDFSKGIQPVMLSTVMTSDYFPDDPLISLKAASCTLGIVDFFKRSISIPESYISDTASNKVSHYTTLSHNLGRIPNFIQLQFSPSMNRNSSIYYPLEWNNHPSQSGNPISIALNENAAVMSIDGVTRLHGIFDSSNNAGWTYYDSGFWTLAALPLPPQLESDWLYYHTTTSANKQILLRNLPANITLVQVQFARTPDPNIVYPFTFRYADKSQGAFGPATIAIESGTLALEMYPGASAYALYDVSPNRWTRFNDGYYRASVYTTKPDFDSGWKLSRSDPGLMTFQHRFNIAPQITQVFFSPDNGVRVYPVTWNYYSVFVQANPYAISCDNHNVILSLKDGGFNVFSAALNRWVRYDSGFWRVTAFKTVPNGLW